MYDRFGLFINGAWTAAQDGKLAPVFSPVTEQSLGDCPVAAVADTDAAIAAASACFAAWRATSGFDRADALHRIADEMLRRTDEAARMISLLVALLLLMTVGPVHFRALAGLVATRQSPSPGTLGARGPPHALAC